MKRTFVIFVLTIVFCAGTDAKNSMDKELIARGDLWNKAFTAKDATLLAPILADDFQFASAGGKCRGMQKCVNAFSGLLDKRPDLHWSISPNELQIMFDWGVAYESGTWIEKWSEIDGEVTLEGRYSFLWKKLGREAPWMMHSALFVPLKCLGESSYCQPKEK